MTLINRTTRLIASAAAIGILVTTAIAPSSAAAGPATIDIGGFDIGDNGRFTPPRLDDKPCDQEQIKKAVCSPDYVASIDTSRSYNTYYEGQRATVFSLSIHNDSNVDGPQELTSSVSTHFASILGFEHLVGDSNWSVAAQNAIETRTELTLHDGLDGGEYTAVWVYVAGWDRDYVSLNVNGSWKSDCCGSWFAHDHLESTTDNNDAFVALNPRSMK